VAARHIKPTILIRYDRRQPNETQTAIQEMVDRKGAADADEQARRARASMELAFEDAMVTDFDHLLPVAKKLPDPGDAHVLAAAVKTQASMIVTENLKHFPQDVLANLNIEAKSADAFIADTIALDEGRAVAAIRRMRERFNKPAMTAADLLLLMDAAGLLETVDLLKPHVESL